MSKAWKQPPPEILAVLDAPPVPWVLLSPDTRWVVFVDHPALADLADVARPKLKLAGVRIDPRRDAHHQTIFGTGLRLRSRDLSDERVISLPPQRRVAGVRWAADSKRLGLTLAAPDATELWCLELASGELRPLAARISAVLGEGYAWLPDGEGVLATLVPDERAAAPQAPDLPSAPGVQDALGETSPLRTYADLLASPHDEELFEHYATSQLAWIDARDGSKRLIGPPAIHIDLDPAPDGRHVLVTRVVRPFSYRHGIHGFPHEIDVLDLEAGALREIVRVPTAENIPIEGVRTGPRALRWHPLEPARLLWLEALDGGDPRVQVPQRDRWMELDAPFDTQARELVRLEHRASALHWFADGERYLVREYDRDRRWTRLALRARDREEPISVLDDRSIKDRYADPGGVLLRALERGRKVVREDDGTILRASEGEGPEGSRPFLDRQELASGARTRLFECPEREYESFYTAFDEVGRSAGFLTRHESPSEPPNLRLYRFGETSSRAITFFTDPTPELRAVKKELVKYRRDDGVELSGTLYLPPNWNGERLPLVLWAYPQDYVDADTAGQVRETPHTFTRIGGASHLFLVMRGFAVLDDPSMPIVGDAQTMNDTFVEQAVSSARAAIEHLAARGIADPARVGIGGHSYGAFMTAMLLAHSELFRAGIARSGAYNRTLTPFGFQSERRTLWEAPQSYLALSPFLRADKIKAPLLLIHGAEDANPGTHPMQSERLFHAIKGTGGVARFVSLPHEGHGYHARESVLHVVAEMVEWFERWLARPEHR